METELSEYDVRRLWSIINRLVDDEDWITAYFDHIQGFTEDDKSVAPNPFNDLHEEVQRIRIREIRKDQGIDPRMRAISDKSFDVGKKDNVYYIIPKCF